MNEAAYQEYARESAGWLKRGRAELLDGLIRRHVRGAGDGQTLRILEVGAGVGQNLPVLARYGTVEAIEVNPIGIARLRESEHLSRLYEHPIPFELERTYDLICALDVVEHLEDDRGAVRWILDHLSPGGSFIATVPAYQWLFSEHDVALGHQRRYTRGGFNALFPGDARVVSSGYFVSTLFPLAASMRLAKKALSLVRSPRSSPSKDSAEMPTALDRAFGAVLSGEAALAARGVPLPFGLTIYSVVRKD